MHIIIRFLMILVGPFFKVFGIEANILNQLLLDLFLDVLPREIWQLYLLIYNLNYVIHAGIKGLDCSLRIMS